MRLNFVDADGDYEVRAEEAIFPDETSAVISQTELALLLNATEGRAITERWLAESRIARDSVRFSLPKSDIELGAGDVVALSDADGLGNYRIDRVMLGGGQLIEAVRVEPEVNRSSDAADAPGEVRPFSAPVPVCPVFMDLPLLSGDEVEHAPHLAVAASPWPGSVAVYSSPSDSGYVLNSLVAAVSVVGTTETTLLAASPAILDRGGALRVNISASSLSSASLDDVLNGANVAAIGDGSSDNWEVFQFTDASLVSPGVYDITGRIRGQAGTDALASLIWPAGSVFVLLNGTPKQISLGASERGLARHYRIGPAGRGVDDPSYTHLVEAFDGIGLRPLAPVHLRATVANSGDVTVIWVRRTRIDGDSWQSVEVPLGEDSESYQVQVLVSGSVVRTETTAVPVWTYTTADQTADGISGAYSIQVAQKSARFGPGLFRRIDL